MSRVALKGVKGNTKTIRLKVFDMHQQRALNL